MMNRRRRPLLLPLLVALAAVGCDTGPQTCEEAACDPETQYCRFYGSDVINEPDSAVCTAIPAECEATPTCECIFTEDFGTCSVEDGLVVVVIPGG